jgi:hypothetical protein
MTVEEHRRRVLAEYREAFAERPRPFAAIPGCGDNNMIHLQFQMR